MTVLLAAPPTSPSPRFSTLEAGFIKNRFSDNVLSDYDDQFDVNFVVYCS